LRNGFPDCSGLLERRLVRAEALRVRFRFADRLSISETKVLTAIPVVWLHAGLHTAGSLPAILALQAAGGLAAWILAAEFFVHYHVDWSKEQINKRYALNFNNNAYWSVFGADQLLHQMTYVVMLAVLVRAASL
jgi:hypothetical protein